MDRLLSLGRRKFLKLASTAGVIGLTGTASAAKTGSDGRSHTLIVHAIDGSWNYGASTFGEIQKESAADSNDNTGMWIGGESAGGAIYEGNYDNYSYSGDIVRLGVSKPSGDALTMILSPEIPETADLAVQTSGGEWDYYISGSDTITKASQAETSDTEYGSSVSGTVSTAESDGYPYSDTYYYTGDIEFIQVADGIFFDL